MILTNGEIYTSYIEAANQTLRPQDERIALAFARAIEAAVLTKLSQGVSVEPVGHFYFDDSVYKQAQDPISFPGCTPLYTTTAIAAARVKAYDECTKLCDPDALGLEQGDDCATGVYRVEKAIRALKEKQE